MKVKVFGVYEAEGTPDECAMFAKFILPDAIYQKMNEISENFCKEDDDDE